jgi:hypothetical protein
MRDTEERFSNFLEMAERERFELSVAAIPVSSTRRAAPRGGNQALQRIPDAHFHFLPAENRVVNKKTRKSRMNLRDLELLSSLADGFLHLDEPTKDWALGVGGHSTKTQDDPFFCALQKFL